jgi:hypothetical protein
MKIKKGIEMVAMQWTQKKGYIFGGTADNPI